MPDRPPGPGQVQTLLTIGQGAPGSPPGGAGVAAAAATDGAPARGRLRLTDSVLAVQSQVQGVPIRILDTLVSALGDRRVGELRDSLRAVGAVLDDLGTRTGARA